MIFLLFLIVLFTVGYICHLKLKQIHKSVENIPGPPLLPFLGNAFEFGTNNIDALINIKRLVRQYGPVVRLCIGPQVCILLSEPKYIAQVISSSESEDKPDFYKLFEAAGGEGLALNSGGEKWRKHRRIIEPMFSSKHLAEYVTIFNANSNKLVERLKPTTNLNRFDATDYVYDYTMKTIFDAAINVDIEDTQEYQAAFRYVFDLSLKRFFSFFQRFDFIYKFTSDYKLLQKSKKIIQDYTKSIIAKRKSDLLLDKADGGARRVLFLDNLLRLSGNDELTDEEIIDEVKTMIVAGADTIGGAISFGLFELAKHPDVQKKILEEANLVLGKDRSADVSFEDAQYLWYTECVYKEILRLYPSLPFLVRQLPRQTKFGNLVVPNGAYIFMFIPGAHMSDKEFMNPEEFNPDRHVPENSANRHSHAFIPFGGGPRICIGQKFSILEAKVLLAKIVRNFEIFPMEPKHELILCMAGTLKSANGLPIRLKIRE